MLMSFNLKPKFSNKKTLKNPVLEPGKVPKREIKEDENIQIISIKENICLSFNSVICYFLAPFEL